jgi:hypothetical protein
MLEEERVMRDVWVMETMGNPLDTNWRQHMLLLMFPIEKGIEMEVVL